MDFRIETLADGKVVRSVQYSSLEELTEKGLQALSFDDLIYLSEEELAQVEVPLKLPVEKINKVSNLAWLCVPCHRMVHNSPIYPGTDQKTIRKIEQYKQKLT